MDIKILYKEKNSIFFFIEISLVSIFYQRMDNMPTSSDAKIGKQYPLTTEKEEPSSSVKQDTTSLDTKTSPAEAYADWWIRGYYS